MAYYLKHSDRSRSGYCLCFSDPVESSSDYLQHWGARKNHKYVARVKEGKKYRYFYSNLAYQVYLRGKKIGDTVNGAVDAVKKAAGDENIYNVNSWNYDRKKQAILNTSDYREAIKNNSNEYVSRDSDGKIKVDYDQYLTDKKHPILDALEDYGNGRKVTIQKQNLDTFMAGAKDYITMGKKTIENIATFSVALLTMKIKNNQGSYDDEKKQIRDTINTANRAASDVVDIYNTGQSVASTAGTVYNAGKIVNDVAKATNALGNAANPNQGSKETYGPYVDGATSSSNSSSSGKSSAASAVEAASRLSSAAITAYAMSHHVDEATAKRELMNSSARVINYYLNNY